MEKIKYRAWLTDEKRMVAVDSIHFDFPHDGTICSIMYIDDTQTEIHDGEKVILLPFIGLLDRNKKEIYKDDIVRYYDSGPMFQIRWYTLDARWSMMRLGTPHTETYLAHIERKKKLWNEYEVIGNIYENPELKESLPKERTIENK